MAMAMTRNIGMHRRISCWSIAMTQITRKQFLAAGGAGIAGSLSNLLAFQSGRKPKNVLLLMSDQHKPDALGIDGDPFARSRG